MHEKSLECHVQVRTMTDMCSHEPASGVLQHHHPVLGKSKNKNPSSPQHQPAELTLGRSQTSLQTQSQIQLHPGSSVSRITISSEHDENSGNGNGSNINNLPAPGGRLKFFKDGKFILELSHRRDGDRTTWFPVPKKTFWPPASIPNRQESSASLSVSDDNSSIQSSPWQRDHCWKQSSPRHNISTEFNFYFRRNRKVHLSVHPRLIARKRRHPLDPSTSLFQLQKSIVLVNKQKGVAITQPKPTMLMPQLPQVRKLNGITPNRSLNIIIDKLARLLDPNVISPRKRILRELERVTLEDQAFKRRATPPNSSNSTIHLNIENLPNVTSPIPIVPSSNVETVVPASKQLSSYSITSILSKDKPNIESEPGFLRNLLKSQGNQAAHCSPQSCPSPQTRQSPQHQPFYGRFATNMETNIAYCSSPPSASTLQHHHPPFYALPMLPPTVYRAPPFCWMHYTQPMHYAPPMPTYDPPPPVSHQTSSSPPVHHYKDYREQTLTPPSDMPLNLSKHAG